MNISTAFRLLTGVFMMTAACEAGPTLLLAGDSTLDDYGRRPRPPYASWGTELEKSMKPGCKVNNFAKSGASTKSFIEAGYWAKLVAAIKPGDYVGIQFGHNDQKCNTKFYLEKRFAPPDGLFKDNVRRFVSDIRAKGAKPILMSPIVRGTFGKDGKLYEECPDMNYTTTMKLTAAAIEAKQWIEAIVNDTDPCVLPEEACAVSEILEAVYESAANGGKPVYFDEK